MSNKSFEIFNIPLITLITMALNFPIAYGITDFVEHLPKIYAYVWSLLPVIYALALYSRLLLHKEHSILLPICFGWITGYSLYMITIVLLTYKKEVSFLISDGGFRLYSLGLFFPMLPLLCIRLATTYKNTNNRNTIHLITLSTLIITLFIYILGDFLIFKPAISYLIALLSFLLGSSISLTVIGLFHRYIRPGVKTFVKITYYLGVMSKPVSAFFIGYLFITIFFSGMFLLLVNFVPHSFRHASDIDILDCFYYSYHVLTSFGSPKLEAISRFTSFLALLENFLGLVWVTVVFAATLGYLQEPFVQLSKRIKVLEEIEVEE